MKRRILIALLSFGTIAGFGSGFASLSCKRAKHRAAFERHVAELCVSAAKNAR
jgi:predicted transporter